MTRGTKTAWSVALLTAIAAVGWAAWRARAGGDGAEAYRTETLDRGAIAMSVSATGTISAVTTVQVGSQVSGIIARLHADFNTPVRRGQLLAELDPTPFQATVAQRQADLDLAEVQLRNSRLHLERLERLADAGLSAQNELDDARADVGTATARVAQARAAIEQAKVNLGNTRIISPVDGVVVSRQFDAGQTVAASFQAPTLFTIAEDLTKMQVRADVDQSDIGRVRAGQTARFTVDAFPEREFRARVSQIRLNATVNQNVVSYPVILTVDNPDGALRPEMTADVVLDVARVEDVLRVPNAALRFRPPAAAGRAGEAAAGRRGAAAGDSGGATDAVGDEAAGGERRSPGGAQVFRLTAAGRLERVRIRTGLTDGRYTEVAAGELAAGDRIVVGLATARPAPAAAESPFTTGRRRF